MPQADLETSWHPAYCWGQLRQLMMTMPQSYWQRYDLWVPPLARAAPDVARRPPSAPAAAIAHWPSRPRNRRRDTPAAVRSAARPILANTGHLPRWNGTFGLPRRPGLFRFGVVLAGRVAGPGED